MGDSQERSKDLILWDVFYPSYQVLGWRLSPGVLRPSEVRLVVGRATTLGMVWGNRVGRWILDHSAKPIGFDAVPGWIYASAAEPAPALIEDDMMPIANIMWHYVGLAHTEDRLDRAGRELHHLFRKIESFYRAACLNDALIGLRSAIQAARIVLFAARRRRFRAGCGRTVTNGEGESNRRDNRRCREEVITAT